MKIKRWRCIYCGYEYNHSKRPTKCSCKSGYVKHIECEKEGDEK